MLRKSAKISLWLGILFFFLYSIYILGYSESFIFKYALVIGTSFFLLDIILSLIILVRSKLK